MLNILPGIAYGFRGSYTDTDCSLMMLAFTESLNDVIASIIDIFGTGTVIAPVFRA